MRLKETLGYAVGDLGINLYFISVMTYLLLFYTDVMGLSAIAAAGVIALARVVDAVTDPLMGMLAERTRSIWSFSTLAHSGCLAARRDNCADVHGAGSGRHREAVVGLYHLLTVRGFVYRGDHSLLGVDGIAD